jgi:hypothetical protein
VDSVSKLGAAWRSHSHSERVNIRWFRVEVDAMRVFNVSVCLGVVTHF